MDGTAFDDQLAYLSATTASEAASIGGGIYPVTATSVALVGSLRDSILAARGHVGIALNLGGGIKIRVDTGYRGRTLLRIRVANDGVITLWASTGCPTTDGHEVEAASDIDAARAALLVLS